jgi:serine/threonine protein kinase
LKPENSGFVDNTLKIFDFDVARVMPEADDDSLVFRMTKNVGSPRYMSPECALGHAYNETSDVYAFGLMLHELITLEKPYDFISNEDHDRMVFHQHIRPGIPSWIPASTKRLIENCWSCTVGRRPKMNDVCSSLQKEAPLIIEAYTKNATDAV